MPPELNGQGTFMDHAASASYSLEKVATNFDTGANSFRYSELEAVAIRIIYVKSSEQ